MMGHRYHSGSPGGDLLDRVPSNRVSAIDAQATADVRLAEAQRLS